MNTQILLYTPTVEEINSVVASAKRRHPALASRIDKAAEILLSGSLQLDVTAWDVRPVARFRVASQSGNGAYVVVGLQCPCQDKRATFCKHVIATQLYMKILANRANTDIRSFDIELGILPDGTFNAWAKGMGYVQMKRAGSAYIFTDAASMVRYSLWLAKREAAQA